MKFNTQFTDKKLETEGAWITWPMDDNIRYKVKRSTHPTVDRALDLLLKQNSKARRNEKARKAVVIKFLSRHVIVDWEGVDCNGEPFEHSVENAVLYLENDFDFYNWIVQESADILNFAEGDEDEEDNTVEERGEELKK